jgi:xanthine/uracil permease
MGRTGDAPIVVLAALLMIGSALVHVHLWDIAYRHVATLGPLFLVQAVGAVVVAVALALSRVVAVMVVAMALMLGTVGGFILADTVGLFGFTLPKVTGWAYDALATELVSTALLALVLLRQARRARAPT